tara:strand:+ start:4044 stop:4307 length:264 start_codon:yes stop_codon:yes gene_type:complete
MSTDPQPANKMEYLNQLELNDKSSLLDDLAKNTMYMDNIKQVKSNDFTPGDPQYLKPYRSVTGKFEEKYKRVIEIDRLSSPPINRLY